MIAGDIASAGTAGVAVSNPSAAALSNMATATSGSAVGDAPI